MQHLPRYLREFTDRLNQRDLDTRDQVEALAAGLVGKRLSYHELRRAKLAARNHPSKAVRIGSTRNAFALGIYALTRHLNNSPR